MGFGLEHLAVKWVARKNLERFNIIAITNAGTTLIGFSVVLVVCLFVEPYILFTLIPLALGFCFFSINTIVFSYFRGRETMKPEAVFLVGQRAFLLVAALFFLAVKPAAPVAAIAFLASLAMTSVFLLPMAYRQGIVLYQKAYFKRDLICSVIKEAIPLALVSSMGIIYYRIDSVMIAAFQQMEDVGIYGGAYMIVEGVMLLVRVIMAAVFSRLSQYGRQPNLMFYRFYRNLLTLILGLALVLAAVMFFAAPVVFALFLGEQYQAAIPVFHILLLSIIALYPGTLATQTLIAIDKQMVYMGIALVCTIVNIFLNLFLIPRYGISGAAWATVISDFMLTGACMIFLFRFLKYQQGPQCV